MTDQFTEIVEANLDEIDLVKNAANGTAFLIAKAAESTAEQNDLPDDDFAYIEPGGKKDDDGKTVPRSLRHFPINDAAHVRDALARASQSPFGEKAMPKIRDAAKKFGIDVAKAAETTEGDADMAEDADVPGSPAWEQVDAALAQQMIDTLTGLRTKLKEACEREQAEVDAGDADDADDVEDLGDVDCALDCALTLLARFLVNEEAEAKEPDEADGPEAKPEMQDEQVAKTALTAEQVQAMIAANNAQVVDVIRESLAKAADDERTIPGTDTVQSPPEGDDEDDKGDADEPSSTPDFDMVKSAFSEALKQVVGEQEAVIKAALATLEERLAVVEATPAAGNVLLNGASGVAGLAERTPDQQDPVEALVKAAQTEADPKKKQELSYQAALTHLLRKPRTARTSPFGADPAEVLARFTN